MVVLGRARDGTTGASTATKKWGLGARNPRGTVSAAGTKGGRLEVGPEKMARLEVMWGALQSAGKEERSRRRRDGRRCWGQWLPPSGERQWSPGGQASPRGRRCWPPAGKRGQGRSRGGRWRAEQWLPLFGKNERPSGCEDPWSRVSPTLGSAPKYGFPSP